MTQESNPASAGADGVADSILGGIDSAKPSTAAAPSKSDAADGMSLQRHWIWTRDDTVELSAFLERALRDPVKAIALEASPAGGENALVRAAFWFEGEPTFNDFVVRMPAGPMTAVLVAVHVKWKCPVEPGDFITEGGAA